MVTPFWRQTWITSGIVLHHIVIGFQVAYPSCLLPALRASESSIKVEVETESWLAACGGLSMNIGTLASSIIMQFYGRKIAHILIVVPNGLGWIIIYFSNSVTMLMIGRLLGGISCGGGLVLGCVTIGEYTCPRNRGMFLGFKIAAVSAGILIMHLTGNFFDWRTLAMISFIPLVFVFINTFTWPESPMWLATRRKFKESEKVFYWLRGKSKESSKEMEELLESQKESLECHNQKRRVISDFIRYFRKFLSKDVYKPAAITLFGFTLLECCGRHTFPAYASDIVGEIAGDMKPYTYLFTITIDTLTATTTFVSSIVSKKVSRRTLLFSSGTGSLIILISLCCYLYLRSISILSSDKSWIPLSLLILYFIVCNLGCVPLPFTLFGEIYPVENKVNGTIIGGSLITVPMVIFLKITPSLLANFGVHGTFAVNGIFTVISLGYLFFALPETHNRTLQEIQDIFNGKKTPVHAKPDEIEEQSML